MQFKQWCAKIFALFFILSSLLLSSWSLDISSATAQGSFKRHNQYATSMLNPKISWEVDVNFIGSNIHAEWILRATDRTSGMLTVIEEYVFDIQCTQHGNVKVNGGKAHFDPMTQDYITCDLPSYRDLAKRMFGVNLDPVCDCVDPWVAAKVHVNQTSQSEYPILFLDEMGGDYFEAQIKDTMGSPALFETNMSRWKSPEWSDGFDIMQPQILWAGVNPHGFVHTLEQRHAQFSNPWINFWDSKSAMSCSGLQSLEAYAATAAPSVSSTPTSRGWQEWHSWARSESGNANMVQGTKMSTEQMTLYIGYSPTSGQYFSGTMKNVGIDPACIGND